MSKISIFAVLILLACGQTPQLSGFNSQKWQEDSNGCNKDRLVLADEVISRKTELMGLNENDISAIFGKPNRHELYSRNKKAYVYFIEGGPDCSEQLAEPKKLIIRFNGVGLVREMVLYKN